MSLSFLKLVSIISCLVSYVCGTPFSSLEGHSTSQTTVSCSPLFCQHVKLPLLPLSMCLLTTGSHGYDSEHNPLPLHPRPAPPSLLPALSSVPARRSRGEEKACGSASFACIEPSIVEQAPPSEWLDGCDRVGDFLPCEPESRGEGGTRGGEEDGDRSAL